MPIGRVGRSEIKRLMLMARSEARRKVVFCLGRTTSKIFEGWTLVAER